MQIHLSGYQLETPNVIQPRDSIPLVDPLLSPEPPLSDEMALRTWSDIRPPLDQAGRIQGVLAGEGSQGTPAANFEIQKIDNLTDKNITPLQGSGGSTQI